MEGEKERQWQQQEEKESNEADDDLWSDDEDGHSERSALDWQEGYDTDNLGLPIMQWEALSLHIAELEKQEEEKRLKVSVGMNLFLFLLNLSHAPPEWLVNQKVGRLGWSEGVDLSNM